MMRSVVRRVESRFEGARGLSLFRRAWLPPQPVGVLVLSHGYAEHSGRYDGLGAWFAARGFAVHALDHQGHGRSAGPRGHVTAFDHFVDDLESFLGVVRQQHPEHPLVLIGHSMGGLIVASYVSERTPTVAAAVTSGALLALSDGISRTRLVMARLLRRVAPRATLRSGLDVNGLSRDPEVVRRYVEDPLVFRRMTTSLASELMSAVERVGSARSEITIPFLMLHGADDPLCPPEGTRVFSERVRGPGSRLSIYPKLRHEIFNEPEQEDVFQDVLDWLRTREK